jgi:CubicO group peptidase (beta-lactamase class C family)
VAFFDVRSGSSAAHSELVDLVDRALADGAFSAAAVLVAVDGDTVLAHAAGSLKAWAAPGVPASVFEPGGAAPATSVDSRFDLASVTKPIVAAALLAELDARGLGPGLAVAELLPEFREPALREVTIAHLLGHTAGFPAEWFDRDPDPGGARFRAGARPAASVGSEHRYSCVGYIWAGFAAEALAEAPLDRVVRARVLDPLGMSQTGFRPEAALRNSIAATEFQPGRGLVHGEVHDETAWALGGVSGNAGLFGTAGDLLRFAEPLRCGGRLDGRQVLPATVVSALTTPVAAPGLTEYRQALGPRIGEAWMRGLGEHATGHTGFTGTAFATQPGGRRSVVFLTNRVHPTRSSTEILTLRGRVVEVAARLGGIR